MTSKYHIIETPDFTKKLKNYKLDDNIFVYNDGVYWKVVGVSVLLKHVIIYDNIDGTDVSIYFCPNTYFSCILPGKYTIHGPNPEMENNIGVVDKNGVILYPILDRIINIKYELKIMTIRNLLTAFTDCLYLRHFDVDNLHDISYLIEYLSNGKPKYKLIIGSIKLWFNYYLKHSTSIRDKSGII